MSGLYNCAWTEEDRDHAEPNMSRRVDDVFYQLSEVTDYLLLGGAPAVTVDRIRTRGVTCVVNAAQLPNLPVDTQVCYLRVAVDDSPTANLSVFFDNVADAVEEHRRRGGRTLVHCVAGVSRSAALVLAHQVKHCNVSLREAFHRLRQRRPVIRPNAGFFQQLIEFERRVRGSVTVKMVRHPAGGGDIIPDVYESEYKRLMGWSDWLRHKNLAHRVSIFRPRSKRGSRGGGDGDGFTEEAHQISRRRQQTSSSIVSLASSLQNFSLSDGGAAVVDTPAAS